MARMAAILTSVERALLLPFGARVALEGTEACSGRSYIARPSWEYGRCERTYSFFTREYCLDSSSSEARLSKNALCSSSVQRPSIILIMYSLSIATINTTYLPFTLFLFRKTEASSNNLSIST